MRVTVTHLGRARSIRLDRRQLPEFSAELARVRRSKASRTPLPRLLAPDCRITVSDGGRTHEYELYGQATLYEPTRGHHWKFYFGLVLMNWLNADTWP